MLNIPNEDTSRVYAKLPFDSLCVMVQDAYELRRSTNRMLLIINGRKIHQDANFIRLQNIKDSVLPGLFIPILAELTIRHVGMRSDLREIQQDWAKRGYFSGFTADDVNELAKSWIKGIRGS